MRQPKLWVALTLLALSTAASVGWLLETMREVRAEARSRFFEQYNRQQLLLAEQASRTMEELFETFRRDLGLVAGLFEVGDVTAGGVEAVKGSIVKVYQSLDNAQVYDVALFDRQGTIVWSYPPSPETVGTNLAWRDYFQWARDKGKPGQFFVTSWIEMKAGSVKGRRALIVASGLYAKDGAFRGLVLFAVNFDEVARKYVLPVRLGQNGYAWLVDCKNRTVLVDPKGRVNGRGLEEAFLPRWPALYALLTRAGDGQPSTGWYDFEDPVNPAKTVRKLVGYAPVRVGGHQWVIGVATPEREVEALLSSFLHRQEVFSTGLGAAILAGAALVCGLLVAWNGSLSRRVALRTADLARARAELVAAEKLAAVGQLALGLTHEIRNPLSAIRMNVQMIREESRPEGPLQENFSIVEEEIQRLNRLLSDVLGFARPKPLRVARTRVDEVVRRVLRLLERTLGEEQVAVEVRAEGDLAVSCDPEQLQQVVLNLLLNAVEAMKECGAEKRLQVGTERDGDVVYLRVEDSGPGVRPEDRDRVFDPFFTTKAQGGGLGLATVQSIVVRHGGAVSVKESASGGAAFVVRLPVDGPPPEGAAS